MKRNKYNPVTLLVYKELFTGGPRRNRRLYICECNPRTKQFKFGPKAQAVHFDEKSIADKVVDICKSAGELGVGIESNTTGYTVG